VVDDIKILRREETDRIPIGLDRLSMGGGERTNGGVIDSTVEKNNCSQQSPTDLASTPRWHRRDR